MASTLLKIVLIKKHVVTPRLVFPEKIGLLSFYHTLKPYQFLSGIQRGMIKIVSGSRIFCRETLFFTSTPQTTKFREDKPGGDDEFCREEDKHRPNKAIKLEVRKRKKYIARSLLI